MIELWGEDRIQAQLEGCKRNKEVYATISRKMEVAGYQKSATQCRDKAKKLKKTYRAIKDKHGKTGEGRKKWLFFEAMDSVLGDKPATRPAVLVDTMDERVLDADDHERVEAAAVETGQKEGDCEDQDFEPEETSLTPSDATSGQEESCGTESTENDPRTPRLSIAAKRQVKKRNREERFEKAMTQVVDRVMKAQEASDSKFVELEEKRMRLEEKLIESEERQRQQDREFQMRMFAMIMQGTPPPPPDGLYSMHSPSVGTSYFATAPSPYQFNPTGDQ